MQFIPPSQLRAGQFQKEVGERSSPPPAPLCCSCVAGVCVWRSCTYPRGAYCEQKVSHLLFLGQCTHSHVFLQRYPIRHRRRVWRTATDDHFCCSQSCLCCSVCSSGGGTIGVTVQARCSNAKVRSIPHIWTIVSAGARLVPASNINKTTNTNERTRGPGADTPPKVCCGIWCIERTARATPAPVPVEIVEGAPGQSVVQFAQRLAGALR